LQTPNSCHFFKFVKLINFRQFCAPLILIYKLQNHQFMYISLLWIHSWVRWIVLLVSILVIIRSFRGWLGNKTFTIGDSQASLFYILSMHLQLTLGLILYFVSPLAYQAIQNNGMGAVMKDATLRPWAVEHLTMMILAVVLAQIGRSRSKKAANSSKKHQNLAIFATLAFILILAGIPWSRMWIVRGF
jgi:hypothetical protein